MTPQVEVYDDAVRRIEMESLDRLPTELSAAICQAAARHSAKAFLNAIEEGFAVPDLLAALVHQEAVMCAAYRQEMIRQAEADARRAQRRRRRY